MPKLARLFIMEWNKMVQYRADLLLWMVAELTTPLVSLAIWYAVARSSTRGLPPVDTLTYYILVMFLLVVTNAWNGYYLARDILNGSIVQYLVRPLPVLWREVTNNIVEKVLKLAIPLPLFLTALFVFPHYFSPTLYSWRTASLAAISILLAATLNFVLDMNFGVIAFWLEDVIQIRRYKEVIHEVSSGVLIPLAFMPEAIRTFFEWLPFAYIISAPAEIMLGRLSAWQAGQTLLYQLAWIAALSLLLRWMWVKGLQRYAVPGQ